MDKDVILAILGKASTYGVHAVTKSIEAYGKDKITLEDIEELETIVKSPEKYFE